MFRGKESSNRIELSRLVQELLNFGVFSFLQLLGVGGGGWMWVGVVGGCPHTCAHACACMHAHACTCMHGKHDNFMQMATPLGKSLGIPYDVICACMCICMCAGVCMCMWVGCTLSSPPSPSTHPLTPQGGPLESFKIQ